MSQAQGATVSEAGGEGRYVPLHRSGGVLAVQRVTAVT